MTDLNTLAAKYGEDELPEGFHKVSLIVNDREFRAIKGLAIRSGEGTYAAGLRSMLGWPETAYGLKAALQRAIARRP